MTDSRRTRRILVVEDNPINQRVTTLTLEKAGYTVSLAENGKEAVEQCHRERFDLVVMDVQMPEMNGLDATAAIRSREAVEGGHLPIIALSANAMTSDREAGMKAGMDVYLAKPVRGAELIRIIDELTGATGAVAAAPPGVLDRSELFAMTGGDAALLQEIIGIFREDSATMLADLRMGIATGEGDTVRRAAHTLAGSLAVFGAGRAIDAARALEAMGRDRQLSDAEEGLGELETLVATLTNELIQLLDTP